MVNTSTNNDQQNPVIVELPGGKWITFWASEPTDAGVSAGLTYDIRGRVFGADGNAIGSEFVVPYTADTQIRPSGQGLEEWAGTDHYGTRNDELYNPYSGVIDVVALEGVNSGKFALVYPNGYSGGSAVNASIFTVDTTNGGNATGVASLEGGTNTVSYTSDSRSASYDYNPSIDALSDGGFVVSWTEAGSVDKPSQAALRYVDKYFDPKGTYYDNPNYEQGLTLVGGIHPTSIVLQQGDSGFSSDAVITATYNTGTAKLRFEVRDALDINGSVTATESVSGYAPSDLIVLNNNTVVAAAEGQADWSDTFGGEINVLKVTETGGTRPYALEITNSSPLPAGAFQVDLVVNESGGFHAVWVIDANYATTNYAPGDNHTFDMDKTVQFAEFDKFGNISWEGVRNLKTDQQINQPSLRFSDDGKLNIIYQYMDDTSGSEIGIISDIYSDENSEPSGGGKVLLWSMHDLGLGNDRTFDIGETFIGKAATGTALIYDDDGTLNDSAGTNSKYGHQKILASTTSRIPLDGVNAIKGYTVENIDTGETFKVSIIGSKGDSRFDQGYDDGNVRYNWAADRYFLSSEKPFQPDANYKIIAESEQAELIYQNSSYTTTGDINYTELASGIMIYENEDFDDRYYAGGDYGYNHRDWKHDGYTKPEVEFVRYGSGSESDWNADSDDNYLGLRGTDQTKVADGILNQEIYKDYVFAPGEEKIFLSFDFLRFDDWQSDKFAVFMDNQQIFEHMPVIDDPGVNDQPFYFTTDGVTYSGTYSITLKEQGDLYQQLNQYNKDDQLFRVEIILNDPPVNLSLGIGTDLDRWVEKNYGIDDVLVANAFVCFARGTLIKTPAGEVRVEDLTVGDDVLTLDTGTQK
ncbi:Hint domain-containing protein, partial [Tateyamaria sp.]|nr:Hint domain-containing protein [Tateyamaria sp.]